MNDTIRSRTGSTTRSELGRLLAMAAEREPVRTAIVHPCDAVSLGGALEALRMKLILPVLVGPPAKIAAASAAAGEDLTGIRIVAVEHSHAAAETACHLARAHVAAVLRARYGANAGGRTIVAHLGGGPSLCAMDAGRSIATTMGFSALDGLVMSSRCGSLDPGIVLHLIRERHMSAEAVSALLYEQSGLLGVSEISGDMQVLLQSTDLGAAEAVDLFVYRIGRAIGSLAAALGGLDTLVFTVGIGENSAKFRQLIGEAAAWLGVSIDPACNGRDEMSIGSAGSSVDVLVIPAEEERAVAEGALECLETAETAPRRGA